MTEQERKAGMMDLLLKHEEQKSKVVCLELKIRNFASPLLTLGNAIKTNFERVTPSQDDDNRFFVSALPHQHQQKPEALEIDLARMRVLLDEYREAVAEKEQIEACMERAGMTRFIR